MKNYRELQNQIIDKFMFENLKRYRDKMDKYRTSLTILNSDQLVKFIYFTIKI